MFKRENMREIKDIYKITYRQEAEFRGTLRNEREFEYGQRVFIGIGSGTKIMVYPAIIKGVKDDGDLENPEYIYKVQIPDWAVIEELSIYKKAYNASFNHIPWYKFLLKYRFRKYNSGDLKDDNIKYSNLSCERIFTSIEQAKESVLKNYEGISKLERDNIDRYFEKFDKVNQIK